MDVERAFLSKVISTGRIEHVVSEGVEAEHFMDEECVEVYGYLIKHFLKYKLPPSKRAIKNQFPDFEYAPSKDALDYLKDRFFVQVKRRAAIEGAREFAAAIDDPERVQDIELEALEFARNLALVVPSKSVSYFSEMGDRIEKYKERQRDGEPVGIKFGIPTLDKKMVGIRPNQYVSILAWTNVGKSTYMQFLQFMAYLQGKTPMMISLEMGSDELFDKWDAMAAEIEIDALKKMELDPAGEEKWYKAAERAQHLREKQDMIIIDNIGRCTVDKVFAETIRYKPDIVGLDYIQLMDKPAGAGAMWEGHTLNSQGLKQNARTLGIPILSAAQSNDEKADLASVAGTKAIVRDSDIVFSLEQDEDAKRDGEMLVEVKKNRGGKRGKAWLKWDMDRMLIREKDTKDYFTKAKKSAKVKDAPQVSAKGVKRKRKPNFPDSVKKKDG